MRRLFALPLLASLLASAALAAGVEKTQGVYVTLLSGLKADVGETAVRAESSLKGLPMRLAVYSEASGVGVAVVNPVSLLRTFYGSDVKDAAALKAVEAAYRASDDVWIVGLTNAKTEGRAYGIAGEKRATEANPFPGLDHAAAFPIEVVVTKKGAGSSVTLLKEMWRMKLYFEDAGNWAFMKNMQMPGDIQNEIEATVRKAVP
ncbi:MAG: hypothetical protein PT977_01955 [Acidobacteriota bacterium]|nr:hypothetical protein [Acidobacteriota bacterium]